MTTKGQKLRNKRANRAKDMPELAATTTTPRAGRPKDSQKVREHIEDNPVLLARKRHTGSGNLSQMRSQALGTSAGRALWLFCEVHHPNGREAAVDRLSGAFLGYCNSQDRALRQLYEKSVYPKCAKIVTEPERFETRDDYQPDLRSEDERDRDARNSEQHWTDILNRLPMAQRVIIQSAHKGWVELFQEAKLTRKGFDFCKACEALADEVERRG